MAPRDKLKCKVCDYESYSPKYLTAHKLKMHMSRNEFTCTICKKIFGRVNNFQWHIRYNLCSSQSSSVNDSNQRAEPTGEYSEEHTSTFFKKTQKKVRFELRKSSKEEKPKNSSATDTKESADQNTVMGDFENGFGDIDVQVRPGSRISSRIQKAKIGSASAALSTTEYLDETAGEVNAENYDPGLQFRPESNMSSKPTPEEEPSCSVIYSEPILRWNTQLTPTIKLERLKTDENAKIIAKWLLKYNVQPELSNTLVVTVEGDVENNRQSTSSSAK